MISISKLAETFPVFLPIYTQSPSFRGLHKLGFVRNLLQSSRFGGHLGTKMAWNQKRCEVGVEINAGIVLPATKNHIEEAIRAIGAGKVIAVPTDTLYGFACDACSAEAVNKIYEIKGRKQTSPLAICVGDVSDITRFAVTDHLPHGLLDNLLPGPVTIVLKRGSKDTQRKL